MKAKYLELLRRRQMRTLILAIVAGLLLLSACSPAAAPASTGKEKAGTSTEAKASTGATGVSPALAQLIEAARKEGQVSTSLNPDMVDPPVLASIREGIKKKYGVDLEINAIPSQSYPEELAKAIAEYRAKAPSSLDVIPASELTLLQAEEAGVAEKVDWEPLLAEGTPRTVIRNNGLGLSIFQSHIGLGYSPKVIPAADAPKSFADLGDPKWRGKIAMYNYANNYLTYAFVMGADKFLPLLRNIMKNNPVVEIYARGQTRYMAGEYPILVTQSPTVEQIKKAGIPAEFVSTDISWLSTHVSYPLKNATHPNAGRLLVLYLASPEGHQLFNSVSRGSTLYDDNFEADIQKRDTQAGLRPFSQDQSPESIQFFNSDQAKQLLKEINDILQGKS